MKHLLYEISIETEMDVVLAHQKTTQLCQLAGFSALGQTQLSTAVSEITRNALEHAERGRIQLYVVSASNPCLEVVVSDTGTGMNVSEQVSPNNYSDHFSKRGKGISNSKRLVDHFTIQSSEQGTTVTLQKAIPTEVPPTDRMLRQWKTELDTLEKGSPSPYEELKTRNHELITLTRQLEEQNEANQRQVEEIKMLNSELDQKNQELTDFAYTLSHDLKNPLNNILALASMAKKAEQKVIFLEKIESSALVIDNILKGLMQIVDLDQDVSGSIKALYFENIINTLKKEYDGDIAAGEGSIRTDFQVESIYYVEPYLDSIIRNLVSNAIKYQAAERPLELTLSTRQQDECVVLSVRDNGMGMDLAKNGDALFRPFRRLTQQKSGKGIGLHLIKKMIEKNRGNIQVESKIGEGTAFHCYLKSYE